MKSCATSLGLLGLLLSSAAAANNLRRVLADDEYCVEITLTGTGGGPIFSGGLAGAGTLVTYGKKTDECRGTNLQFDMGRGTTLQLSKLGLEPVLPPVYDATNALDAIFFTHLHNDHTDDFYVYMSAYYQFLGNGGGMGNGGINNPIDVVCSENVTVPESGVTSSCQAFVDNIGVPMIASGEVAQRESENGNRVDGGPSDLANVMTFALPDRKTVWTSADGTVTVEAVGSKHIGGHASYRINTPAGSVVIGGDASRGTDETGPEGSTSRAVESLAKNADVLVHSTIHPVFGPGQNSSYPSAFYERQSNAPDVGAMALRANVKNVMLTHLIPSLGVERFGRWDVPGGALDEDDYKSSVESGGYKGEIFVGGDLTTKVRIPKDA